MPRKKKRRSPSIGSLKDRRKFQKGFKNPDPIIRALKSFLTPKDKNGEGNRRRKKKK